MISNCPWNCPDILDQIYQKEFPKNFEDNVIPVGAKKGDENIGVKIF